MVLRLVSAKSKPRSANAEKRKRDGRSHPVLSDSSCNRLLCPPMANWRRAKERLTNWELWPFALIYAPLGPLWLWYALKARSFWWFSPANPTLTFAGFDGEGKKEMYDQLPEDLYPKTVYVQPHASFEKVQQLITQKGISYPLCAKPDVGLKGLLFRKIDDEERLRLYHEKMPVDYWVQSLVEAPLEVSVFYHRHPNKEKGVISGFIRKEMMHVVGDGRRMLWELMAEHPKARHRLEEMRIKHERKLQTVLPRGEEYILVHAANLNRGATFTNLKTQIDQWLLNVFDPLSHRCRWYYGRYDIKCNGVEELKEGKFTVLEFNGAGAEPNHVYNAGYSWLAALRVFAHHWKALYRIGRHNHKRHGVRYWGNREGWTWMSKARKHGELLQRLDAQILI